MKKIIILLQLGILTNLAFGQQYPYFSQFVLNPYVYNPATLGNSGYNELNLIYRQQWLGITDAPITQAFNFQYPTKNNVSFGINFYNDKAVLLSTSAVTVGFAYNVRFSEDNYLKFGLSSGIGLNNFDLDKVDNPDDPAIHDVLNRTSFMSGQFGVFYNFHGLEFGFSLPQLYKFSAIDTVDFQKINIAPLDNYIFTASYKFNFGSSDLGLKPFILYRKSELLPLIIEAGALLDYKDLFWIGGSYRKDYGGTGFIGINIKKNIIFSYAYEFAGGQHVSLGNGSHEFNFKIRFGRNKHQKTQPLIPHSNEGVIHEEVSKKHIAQSYTLPASQKSGIISSDTIQKNSEISQYFGINEDEKIVEKKLILAPDKDKAIDRNFGKPKPTFASGYYVILGAFEIFDNAIEYSSSLSKMGISSKYGYVDNRSLYYVYNLFTQDIGEADRLRNQFKKHKAFQDTWVYEVK